MGADPFFRLLGALFLLLWNIVLFLFKAVFWMITLGKWKIEEKRYQSTLATAEANRVAEKHRREAELLSRNTLYGRQE
jgi:hypothetical protein